jgi:hypothetical protein
MRSKILEIQMDWENRERMEESMAYNQFAPAMPQNYFVPRKYLFIYLFIYFSIYTG